LFKNSEERSMKKVIATVALATVMGTASAGFFGFGSNNYGGYNDNGIFGFNPYSFMTPGWFIEEMDNFADEFSNDNYYGYNGYRNVHYPYNRVHSNNKVNDSEYLSNYMRGYSNFYR
jgi:hypothetical protein